MPGTAASRASYHGPPSTLTSTAAMPLCCAQATPGNHVIEARATDKTGYTQTAVQAQPVPNGASGYPSAAVTIRGS